MSAQKESYKLHVISHTHWDREWHHSFQDFRARLVEFMDYLLELMESNPEYRYFHLDGQTVILEDYLDIIPENEARLRKLIRNGRILVGPWYVQPDEFLVSGESLIRNLLLGDRIAGNFGNSMKIGYIPDSFGHNSQMPQILKGFGIDNAVLFRGITGDQVKSEFIWEGADGSRITSVKMPDDNAYSSFFYELRKTLSPDSTIDPSSLKREVAHMIAENSVQATTVHLLGMDGVDHIFPNPKTPEIINWINRNVENVKAVHATLPQYMAVLKRAVSRSVRKLQLYKGELRISNRKWRLQALLEGVMSSRMYLKLANHEARIQLEMWAEPMATAAWGMGDKYPYTYLRLAWKYLLKNHAHDSICGCSIDQVHDDMMYRFDQSRLISTRIVNESLRAIAQKVDTSDIRENEQMLMICNPLSWFRTEVARIFVDFPVEQKIENFSLRDLKGAGIPYQIINRRDTWDLLQERHGIPHRHSVNRYEIAFMGDNIPPMGYSGYVVSPEAKSVGSDTISADNGRVMQNEHLKVEIASNGTFRIVSRKTGRKFPGLSLFEDGGDVGDGYKYRKPVKDRIYTSRHCNACVSMVEKGVFINTFKVDLTMSVPREINPDRKSRSAGLTDLHITSFISLSRNSRRVDISTTIRNIAKDHRLRVCFPSGVNAGVSRSESQFDILEREITGHECGGWIEPMPVTHPQLTFCGLGDGKGGVVIINKGLPEYEVKDDTRRTIALTLLRGVGSGVGKPEEMIKGQCRGEYTFEYSVMPYDGEWDNSKVWREGYNRNVPLKGIQTGKHSGTIPGYHSFVRVSNEKIVLTAMKKCEDRDSVILRFLNISGKKESCSVEIPFSVKNVYETNLNEERKAKIKVKRLKGCSAISVIISSKRLFTAEIELKKTMKAGYK